MPAALVVTPEAPERSEAARDLREAGWRAVLRRPKDDLSQLLAEPPDVVVVEVAAGGDVGLEVEPFLRVFEGLGIPVLAVVAEGGLRGAAGLAGLADFAVRPFRRGEVAARARRRLSPEAAAAEGRIREGGLVIDLEGFKATLDERALDLTYQEFRLLAFLARHPGRAFNRDQLLTRVWGADYYGGSRTVDIHVRRIRAKLGDPHARSLVTIRQVGYKWVPGAEAGG